MNNLRLERSPSVGADKLTAREQLLRAVRLLPEGTALTLLREQLLEALRGPEPAQPEPMHPIGGDRLLTAGEAAERLGVDRRWLYEHADDLPFRRKLSDRCTRYSESALEDYMAGGCDHCGNNGV